jgi:hypothetical protein
LDMTLDLVIKPIFPMLKASNDRVTSSRIVFRGMLIGHVVAATYVTTLSASPKVQPSSVSCQAFDTSCTTRLNILIVYNSRNFFVELSF